MCPEGKQGSFDIPAGVENIVHESFSGCLGLKRISIPGSVTSIEVSTFCMTPNGDAGLEAINVSADNPVYSSIDGLLCSKDGKTLLVCPQGKQGNLDIPDGITDIRDACFEFCVRLTNITIPNTVTRIGDCAFRKVGIKSVYIPSSVISIGGSAFTKWEHDLKDVYYAGSEEQWKKIDIGDFNEDLLNAAIHYNSNGIETVTDNPDNTDNLSKPDNPPKPDQSDISNNPITTPVNPITKPDNSPKPDQSDKQDVPDQPGKQDTPDIPDNPATKPNDSSITPLQPDINSPEPPNDQTETVKPDDAVPADVLEAGESCQVGTNSYIVSEAGSEVIFTQTSAKQNVVIPSTIMVGGTSYKVTAIMANALKGNKKVKKIIIGKNVKIIGKNAFNGCTNLKTIMIQSADLEKVEKNALKGIHNKAKIKVPKNKFKAYKKLLKGKGQGKKVKIYL